MTWANATGYLAGKSAVEFIKNRQANASINMAENGDIFTPLKFEGKYNPREIIWELSAIMGNGFVTIIKTEERLLRAIDGIELLINRLNYDTVVTDHHELMIWYEAISALTTAKLSLEASIFRKETRGGHFREDFPSLNPELNKPLKICKDNNKLKLFY